MKMIPVENGSLKFTRFVLSSHFTVASSDHADPVSKTLNSLDSSGRS